MGSDGILPVAFLPQDAHGLTGRLGFAPAPGRWRHDSPLEPERMLAADLAWLRERCGEAVLATLLEEGEMWTIGLGRLLEEARRAGLESLWFPIRDGTAPPDLDQAAQGRRESETRGFRGRRAL